MSILSDDTRNELLANLQSMFEDNQLQIESLQRTNNRITNLFINLISARGGAPPAEENYNGPSRTNSNSHGNVTTTRRNITSNQVLPPLPVNINTTVPNTTLQSLWTSNANVNNLLRSFYERDPRSSIPSLDEVNRSTETTSFASLSNPLNTTCPITLESFQNDSTVTRIRTCGHVFNQSALERWLHNSAHCPMCRVDIREPIVSNQQQQNAESQNQTQTQVPTQQEREQEQEREQAQVPSAERPESTALVAAQLTEMAMSLLNTNGNNSNAIAQTSISNIHHNPEDDSIYFDIESDELVNALSRIASDSLNRMLRDNQNESQNN